MNIGPEMRLFLRILGVATLIAAAAAAIIKVIFPTCPTVYAIMAGIIAGSAAGQIIIGVE